MADLVMTQAESLAQLHRLMDLCAQELGLKTRFAVFAWVEEEDGFHPLCVHTLDSWDTLEEALGVLLDTGIEGAEMVERPIA